MQIATAPTSASKNCHKSNPVEEFEEQHEVDPPTTSDATDAQESAKDVSSARPPPRRSARDRRRKVLWITLWTSERSSAMTLLLKLPMIKFILRDCSKSIGGWAGAEKGWVISF